MYGGLQDGDDFNDVRAQDSPGRNISVPQHPLPSPSHLSAASEPTSPLLCLKKKKSPHQHVALAQPLKGDEDVDMDATGARDCEQDRRVEDAASGEQGDAGSRSGVC